MITNNIFIQNVKTILNKIFIKNEYAQMYSLFTYFFNYLFNKNLKIHTISDTIVIKLHTTVVTND